MGVINPREEIRISLLNKSPLGEKKDGVENGLNTVLITF